MSVLALTILILSAFMHASWNFLAKQSKGGNLFVWFYIVISSVILTPIAIIIIIQEGMVIDGTGAVIIGGSILLHIIYALSLQYGYKIGDLSLVYPIARGTGPFIVAISAIFLYGETITWKSGSGILLIMVSIFILSGGLKIFTRPDTTVSILFGIFIGVTIASYTLVDKAAVSVADLSPIIYFYLVVLGQAIVLAPVMLRQGRKIGKEWKRTWKYAVSVGVLSPTAYILVLSVMTFTPVSYVAPVREFSILIGTVMGSKLLLEKAGKERIIGAILMIFGVTLIAIS